VYVSVYVCVYVCVYTKYIQDPNGAFVKALKDANVCECVCVRVCVQYIQDFQRCG